MCYMVNIQTLFVIKNSDIFRHIHVLFRHIQPYCRVILNHVVSYLQPCVTLAYSEPGHIQNPGIFRTQDIFVTLLRHILAYSERFIRLAY